MAYPAVPTLQSRGTVKDPKAAMLTLFKYWIASDPKQSNMFNVESLGSIIRRSGKDSGSLVQFCRTSLENLYGPYFDEVSVVVEVKDLKEAPDSLTRYDVQFSVSALRGTQRYDLQEVITDAFNQSDTLINKLLKGAIT
jgi:hypothetical protein